VKSLFVYGNGLLGSSEIATECFADLDNCGVDFKEFKDTYSEFLDRNLTENTLARRNQGSCVLQ
jgi:hypothetical protein